jgi:hypothetical protein
VFGKAIGGTGHTEPGATKFLIAGFSRKPYSRELGYEFLKVRGNIAECTTIVDIVTASFVGNRFIKSLDEI